ncbi:hypothetical protein QAD02_012769 [Eretmocerus hayati]|uniref:Uncharacterized protein n=1 Tax=Eretmocerus hayati TaxID=131215 RepID=A0ACC2P0U5_9HYME|nr:hypothetical protein QAD02_012769 [Eretmocerus hayati]
MEPSHSWAQNMNMKAPRSILVAQYSDVFPGALGERISYRESPMSTRWRIEGSMMPVRSEHPLPYGPRGLVVDVPSATDTEAPNKSMLHATLVVHNSIWSLRTRHKHT